MFKRTTMVGGTVVILLMQTSIARSQEVATEDAPASDTVEEIVVVGSRAAPRLATETPAPVDSFSAAELQARGFTDLARTLQFLAPSVNYPRTATGPSAANTRAISLRGLSPDQVLVLIDGKRRHASSVINFNNVVGRGSVPVDLNTIPMSAIERIEILRDGAAAQYGSDAIAGVINVVLRAGRGDGFASIQGGVTEDGDGESLIGAAHKGVAIGDDGMLALSGEARSRRHTNGAAIDSRFDRVTNRQGDPDSVDVNLVAKLEKPVSAAATTYANATLAQRKSESAAQFRAPTVAAALYPDGFLPLIELDMVDLGGTIGLRGRVAGWDWDLSNTAGFNRADFQVSDTANTSLGAASPTRFDAGGTRYLQDLVDLGFTRLFADLLEGLNVATGVEYRYEAFELQRGEPASLSGAGAQGFPGFNPPGTVDENRSALSAYLDLELAVMPGLNLGAAVRHEHYDDFGNETIGKLSAFARPASWLGLRASGGSGFRAPSLQQGHFATVSSQSSAGVLVNVGTFGVDDPVARALGASALKPETSRQLSGGLILTPLRQLSLSLDFFHIDIDDRIVLSESLSGPAVNAALTAAGITNVSQLRFFTNAARTRTDGYDLTLSWRRELSHGARVNLALGYTAVDTDLRHLDANPVVPALPLLGPSSIALLTTAQPEDKLVLNTRVEWRAWSATLDVSRFGSFRSVPVVQEQQFGASITVDLGLSYQLNERLSLEGGVINATDEYPERIAERALLQGGSLQYTETGAIGVDGREYFLRLRTRL